VVNGRPQGVYPDSEVYPDFEIGVGVYLDSEVEAA
jgi:hypothetical protein